MYEEGQFYSVLPLTMTLQRSDIQQVLKNHLNSQDFEIISCDGSDIDDVSMGFLSAADKARIRYKFRDEEKDLQVFIKTLPLSSYHRQIVVSIGSFLREAVLFNGVLKKFHDMLQDNTIPKCFLARQDLIVMEDMTKKGFKNKDVQETFGLVECEKTFEALAKFHSLSFITEKKEGRKMNELEPIIKTEMIMSKEENHLGRKCTLVSIKALKQIMEKYLSSQYSADVMKKGLDYMANSFDEMKSSKLYPNVLSHSDVWCNNIMFRYGEDGLPKEVCILDFQLVTYKSPAYDILLFLHTCTDKEFRDKHYDHLMKHYYNSLSNRLSLAGIDVEDLMTWDDFQNSLEESLPVVLFQACFYIHFVMIPEDVLKDVMVSDSKYKVFYEVDRTGYILESMKKPFYKERLLETLSNFLNYFASNRV